MSARTPVVLDDPAVSDAHFLEGVLSRTLDRMHREADRIARRRLAALLAVAVIVLLASLSLGVLAGRQMSTHAHSVAVATVFTATDPVSGAHLFATATAQPGGARLTVAVAGLPPGTACRLYALAADGSRVDAGGWRTSAAPSAPPPLSVYLDPALVAAVELTTANGTDLTARLTKPPDHLGVLAG